VASASRIKRTAFLIVDPPEYEPTGFVVMVAKPNLAHLGAGLSGPGRQARQEKTMPVPPLSRNAILFDGDIIRGTPVKGRWIVVPETDFDGAREALRLAGELADSILMLPDTRKLNPRELTEGLQRRAEQELELARALRKALGENK
jgi:hypothetical protein